MAIRLLGMDMETRSFGSEMVNRDTPRSRFSDDEAAVEGVASGAADSFDGNEQDMVVSWLFANRNWQDSAVPTMLDELMQYTIHGHLAWVCFPRPGFRIVDTVDLREMVN